MASGVPAMAGAAVSAVADEAVRPARRRARRRRRSHPRTPTSERILDAALALAAASGLRHLTMDDIAARAKVGRMTVYRRFGDKQRLLEALGARRGPPMPR